MKRLLKVALLAGVVAAAVTFAVFFWRKRGAPPALEPAPWLPPTVETTPAGPGDEAGAAAPAAPEAEMEEALAVADDEGMTPPAEELPVDIAVGSESQAVVSELAPPEASEELVTAADEALEEALAAVADDEGMAPPPAVAPDDLAMDAAGNVVVSDLAAPGAAEEFFEAEADAATIEVALEAIEFAPEVVLKAEEETEAAEDTASAPTMAAPPPEPIVPPAPVVAEAPAETPVAPEEELLSSVEEALTHLDPSPIVVPPRRSAESYLDEGNVYFNVGQYGLAVERYGQAIALDDSLTAAYYNRANAHTRAGSFDQALEDYNRALELQPQDADALNNRGMLHLYRSSYEAALGDFNRALEIDPADTTVMVNRGLALLHSGNAAGALVDFREATRRDANDAAAQYGAAQAAAALGNRDEALRFVARALELDPGYAREAAGDPRLDLLSGDEEFMKLLRQSGTARG